MKPLQLDFIRKPRVVPWLGLLFTALGIVTVLWVLSAMDVAKQQKVQLDQKEDDIRLALRKQDERKKAAQNASPVSEKVDKQIKAQRQSADTGLTLLEDVWQPEIAITRLEISTLEHDIKLDIEAKSLNDALLFVDRLQAHPKVQQVQLLRNSIKVADPYRPAVASLEIVWRASGVASLPMATAASAATATQEKASRPMQPSSSGGSK